MFEILVSIWLGIALMHIAIIAERMNLVNSFTEILLNLLDFSVGVSLAIYGIFMFLRSVL
ncbi:MAG: hypothetical protein PHS93_07870 [Candidatus Omnitrophica bacterium]|nr:hypothetical protein [Candidatus Omnitrophota bacterium]